MRLLRDDPIDDCADDGGNADADCDARRSPVLIDLGLVARVLGTGVDEGGTGARWRRTLADPHRSARLDAVSVQDTGCRSVRLVLRGLLRDEHPDRDPGAGQEQAAPNVDRDLVDGPKPRAMSDGGCLRSFGLTRNARRLLAWASRWRCRDRR